MKIIHAEEAKEFKNADTCTAFEYLTGKSDINLARVDIHGRYPLVGTAVNTEVSEIVYVEEGYGNIGIGDELLSFNKGDVIYVEKRESVWWEGNCSLIIACAPAWTKDQYLEKANVSPTHI